MADAAASGDVDVGGDAYNAIRAELQERDYGTDEDDLKAYAQVGGAAAAAAGCAAIGAAVAGPLCASAGAAIVGEIWEFFADFSGPSDEEVERRARSARFNAYLTIQAAYGEAVAALRKQAVEAVRKPTGASEAQAETWLADEAETAGAWYVVSKSAKVNGVWTHRIATCEQCNAPPGPYQVPATAAGLEAWRAKWGLPPAWMMPRTDAELAAYKRYCVAMLGYMAHDLRAVALLVLAKFATNGLRWSVDRGKITVKSAASPMLKTQVAFDSSGKKLTPQQAQAAATSRALLWLLGAGTLAGGAWYLTRK